MSDKVTSLVLGKQCTMCHSVDWLNRERAVSELQCYLVTLKAQSLISSLY